MVASVRSELSSIVAGNTTTHTYTYPSSILAGDPIVCIGSMDDNSNGLTASGWPTGWVQLFEIENAAGADDMTGFGGYLDADGTEDNGTFDITSASSEKSAAHVVAFQDAAAVSTDPPAVPGTDAAGTSASPDPPAITGLTADDYLFFAMAAIANADTFTAFPSGYSNTGTTESGGGGSAALGWAFLSTTGVTAEDAGPFTITSMNWAAQNIVIYPAAGGGLTGILGIITETDLASGMDRAKARGIGLTAETDFAFAMTGSINVALGLASETDTAQPFSTAKQQIIGLLNETNLAQSFGVSKAAAIGIVNESDLAQAISVGGALTVIIGQVTEIDLAQSFGSSKQRAINLLTETDVAQAVNVVRSQELGLASEASTLFSIASLKALSLNLVAEIDTAFVMSPDRARQLGLVSEADSVFALNTEKARSLGLQTETDVVFAMTPSGPAIILVTNLVSRDVTFQVILRRDANFAETSTHDALFSEIASRDIEF